jgi:N-acetylglucosamine-6-sulfatase
MARLGSGRARRQLRWLTPVVLAVVTALFLSPAVLSHPAGGAVEPASGSPTAASQQAAVPRPNVLLVVTDDQKEGTVIPQVMPATHRELVQNGFRFTNSYVTNAWCCPSRASILTGQYSHTNGVWTVGGPRGMAAWFPHEGSTLATWLQGAGYRTGIVGKYLNEFGTANIPAYQPPGWDTTAIMTNLVYSVNPGYFNYNLWEGDRLVHYGATADDYSTRVFTRKAREFVAPRSDGKPWFLYLAYTSPHGPPINDPIDKNAAVGISYPMPANVCESDVSDKPAFVRRRAACSMTQAQYNNRMRGQQAKMLVSVDRGLGQIIADLKRTGQMRDTLVIYISDNGYFTGNHRFLVGKELPYEESVRVPLMMRWDALGQAPRSIGGLALNIDLAPTITEAAGVTQHNPYDGTSLLGLLDGSASSVRADFLLEHLTTGPNDPGGPSYCAVRNRRFKYVEYSTGERELYDLVADPAELTSRHQDPAFQTRVSQLRNRMLQLCSPPPPGWTPR